jgi:hypothetical protein
MPGRYVNVLRRRSLFVVLVELNNLRSRQMITEPKMRNGTRFWRVIMTMKKGWMAIALILAAVPANLVAQSSEKETLAGVWEAKISADGVQSPLLSIAIFGQDGSFTTSGNTKFSLAPPNQGLGDQRGPGYGRWAQTGDKEFKLTFYVPLLNEGEVNGYMRVRCTISLSESGTEFTTRECLAEFMDTNLKVLDSDKDEVKGTRLETP